jgi:hypothetical protein
MKGKVKERLWGPTSLQSNGYQGSFPGGKSIRNLYTGINKFKEGYQPRNNIIKVENGNLIADFHSILNMWKNFFRQVLNVHGIHNVRQTDIVPLVPQPSLDEVEIAIGKLKSYKSPGTDHIST